MTEIVKNKNMTGQGEPREPQSEQAVDQSINECIANDVLADFLKKNRSEVKKMGLYEYDEEKYIQMEREDAREEGRTEGQQLGELLALVTIIKKKHLKKKPLDKIADEMEKGVEEIQDLYKLIEQDSEMENEKIVERLLQQRK